MTKKTKRAICIYVALLLLLYVVVEILPKVTDIFETTQILEPGNLTLSYSTTGYFIKTEYVCIAAESGDISYQVEEGTAVKKGHPLVTVTANDSGKAKSVRFNKYTKRLKGYAGISSDYNSPISGVFCLEIDGYEDYFTFDNMEKVKREKVESLKYDTAELRRKSVIKGEPLYKISADESWYILCWTDEETAKGYTEGKAVTLELPDGSVAATVYKIIKEGDGYRVLFALDVYYESFAQSRAEEMDVVISDNTGLIIENKCIIQKDGANGVYVKNKNGKYVFKKISIIATDGKESAIEDSTFVDAEGNQVYTVDVYDEVLKNPQNALEEDQKKTRDKAEKAKAEKDKASQASDSQDGNKGEE